MLNTLDNPDNTRDVAQDADTVAALKRRTLILLAIVTPAIILTAWLIITESRSMRRGDVAQRVIPATVVTHDRTWTSVDMTFSDLELAVLETSDYVYRTYSDGKGIPVDLCVIFSEDNRKGTHPPDVCLEASGLRIVSNGDRVLFEGTSSPLTIRELVTTNASGHYSYFAYFYKCGDTFTPSFYKQQVQIIWNGLTRQNASGALIRFSTPMANASDLPAARQRLDALLQATFPAIRDGLNETR